MFGLFLSLQAKRNPLFPQLPARDEGFATMIKIDHFNPFHVKHHLSCRTKTFNEYHFKLFSGWGGGWGVPHLLQLSNTLFAGWGKGGVEGLWSGDGDLHLDPDRPLPSRRRLSCQETDQPGAT